MTGPRADQPADTARKPRNWKRIVLITGAGLVLLLAVSMLMPTSGPTMRASDNPPAPRTRDPECDLPAYGRACADVRSEGAQFIEDPSGAALTEIRRYVEVTDDGKVIYRGETSNKSAGLYFLRRSYERFAEARGWELIESQERLLRFRKPGPPFAMEATIHLTKDPDNDRILIAGEIIAFPPFTTPAPEEAR